MLNIYLSTADCFQTLFQTVKQDNMAYLHQFTRHNGSNSIRI